ncbi:MAG: DUF115 domain-containing protein [Magnetococcales bacterium]|nr:DUF115 domain-containing protein [Magnetococcales bacterium]
MNQYHFFPRRAIIMTDDFGPFLRNAFGEPYLPALNRESFSGVGSEAVFRRIYLEDLWEEDALYLFVGCDGGLLIRYILRQPLPAGSRYLFVEFEALIPRIRREVLPEGLPHQMLLLPPGEWVEAATKLGVSDYYYSDRVRAYKSLAAADGFHPGYVPLWNRFKHDLGMIKIQVDMDMGNQIFLLRGMENLAENLTPAPLLRDVLPGATGILLAGGPSWEAVIPWVKAHREHLLVAAVSRNARQLREAGVIPDLFMAIDPYDIIFHNGKEMLDFWQESLYVNFFHVHPWLLAPWRGRSAYMGYRFPWPTENNPDNYYFPGITVSHQLLGLMVEMGCRNVVLAGLDLCFSREGYIYAKGSAESALGPSVELAELQVETNGGWMAETWYDFYHAIPSLGQVAEFGAMRGCAVINPAPGAAKVPHVRHQPLESVAIAPLPRSARETLWERLPLPGRAERLAHCEAVERELFRVRGVVEEIRALAAQGIELNDRLFGRQGKPADFSCKDKMDRLEEELNQRLGPWSLMVRRWGVSEFLRLSRPDKEKAWSVAEVERTGRRYYEIYRESAAEVVKFIDAARQRVRSRVEEEKERPDFKLLFAQWERDQTPGRAQVYLDRCGRPLADHPPAVVRRLEAFLAAHEALFHGEELSKRSWQTQPTPATVRAKAQSFFLQKELEKLRDFVASLPSVAMADREPALHLARGLLRELENDPEAALAEYRQVDHPELLPDALQRMTGLTLGRGLYEEGRAVLRRMAELSPAYVPPYAELLRLLGDQAGALDAYRRYLAVVSGDGVTLIKAARFLVSLGRTEEARELYQRVLRDDPLNQAARRLLEALESPAAT